MFDVTQPKKALPLIVLGVALSGCTGDAGGGSYPFGLEPGAAMVGRVRPVDFNGDGIDELFNVFLPTGLQAGTVEAVMLASWREGLTDQVNFHGSVREPLFQDVAGDSDLEMIVPSVRNDSLFLTVVDARGMKLNALFLTSGAARVEPEGVIAWDPKVVNAQVADLDGDGAGELITVVTTGLARSPRGVFVHRLSDGELLGSVQVGAKIQSAVIDDFDGDGQPEVFVATQDASNGGRAGGFDDSQSYYILFEVWPRPHVAWHTGVPQGGIPVLVHHDFDADGRRDILAVWWGSRGGRLAMFDTRSWRPRRTHQITGRSLSIPAFVDVDRDGSPEILLPSPSDGELLLFDHGFALLRASSVSFPLGPAISAPDIDGDGVDEIMVRSDSSFALFGPDLKQRTALHHGVPQGVIRTGVGSGGRIVVHTEGGAKTFALVRNPWYLLYRYGPWTGGTAGAALLLLGSVSLVRSRRRRRLLEGLRRALWDDDAAGILLMDRRGRLVWINEGFRRVAGLNGQVTEGRLVSELFSNAPAVVDVCEECLRLVAPQAFRRAEVLRLSAEEGARDLVAQPVFTGLSADPHWLVRSPTGAGDELAAAGTSLAARVVHDLRNSLTSVRLTLQRMQVEYRAASPELAGRLNPYSERLQERIDYLRRLTTNFLKVLGDEKPQMEMHDVNRLVHDTAESIRLTLPPDVQLRIRLADGLPEILLDREQMESVLENLVANALHAMPDGGLITCSTGRGHGRDPATECVVIEVLDTGTGIPRALVQRVFEPGFTTGRPARGLGLMIVKRIIDAHGGDVSVESDEGVGTAFAILLPVPTPHLADR